MRYSPRTLILSEVYFFNKDGSPDFLALLYTLFLFLNFALMFLFIQGILCLVEMVTFGMHSSIIPWILSPKCSPIGCFNQSVSFFKVSLDIFSNGTFSNFRGRWIPRPFQGESKSIVIWVILRGGIFFFFCCIKRVYQLYTRTWLCDYTRKTKHVLTVI